MSDAARSKPSRGSHDAARIERAVFGRTPDGAEVGLHTLAHRGGAVLRMADWGATIVSLEVPDRRGRIANVALGFPSLEGYLSNPPYFGATIGRTCNRIAFARFRLDGKTCALEANDGRHHLHGGPDGFGTRLWRATPERGEDRVGVRFELTSHDGEGGYPGRVHAIARYALTDRDELIVEFEARSDRATPVGLTNHGYWNLRGDREGSIEDHLLELFADRHVAVDDTRIPTGELPSVEGTPLDFRRPRAIGERIDEIGSDPSGYDHCLVVRGEPGRLRPAARLRDPVSGRRLDVETTQPGLQLYSGNFLDGSSTMNGYAHRAGLCLETQAFPDSPNQPDFPDTILRPGTTYHHTTVYRFATD